MLKLENVSKTFNPGTVNAKTALDGLNLTLNEGDFVTVIGGNGAGKSTMLNIVAGAYTPDGGTITIDGEDTYVFVCVHKADATFYYDSEDQVLFGYVEYPITFGDNVWDIFRGTDFSDLNGDGNGDVTMKFADGGTEIKIVWFWDSESEQFVYQPDNSNIPA